MVSKAKTLTGYRLETPEGEIGRVRDFHIDVQNWAVRYLVADTGTWLRARQVLISPHAITSVSEPHRRIDLNLTRKQIEDSPPLEKHQPVSQQFQTNYHMYFGWPGFWGSGGTFGGYPFMMPDGGVVAAPGLSEADRDPHLLSTDEVHGYSIESDDGRIGHVDDLVIDEETWAIRYLIIDTRNWWPGKKVLIAPSWIDRISSEESKIFVTVSRDQVKQSPEYSEAALIARDYEIRLHQHYYRKGYWSEESALREPVH